MQRRLPAILLFAVLTCFGQDAPKPASLKFEVASIRPSAAGARGIERPTGAQFRATDVTLLQLLNYSYENAPLIRHDPVPIAGPAWMDADRFDVIARGADRISVSDSRLMLLALLEERFGLRTHTEKRDLPVYALVLARRDGKLGEKLRRSSLDCAAYSAAHPGGVGPALQPGDPPCGLSARGGRPGRRAISGAGLIADMLQPLSLTPEIDRKIIDQTGLTGAFDIDFEWAAGSRAPAGAPDDAAIQQGLASIFTALQDQLGLRLEARRAPVQVVIIDSIERLKPE